MTLVWNGQDTYPSIIGNNYSIEKVDGGVM